MRNNSQYYIRSMRWWTKSENYLLKWIIGFIAALNLILGARHHFVEPNHWKGIFWSDSEWYYQYLPATFLYGWEEVPINYGTFVPGEKAFSKYTYGVAAMEAPFFGLAHATASFYKLEPTGYTPLYASAILLAATFYGCLGLYLLGRMLMGYFGKTVSLLVVIALYFGTNLMYYMMKEPGMSHVYSFALIALLLWLLRSYYDRPTILRNIALGALAGLIVLTRPTNAIALLLIPFWGITSKADIKARISFFTKRPYLIAIAAAAAFLVFFPQMAYWKYVKDSWIYYSYQEEGFTHWNNPKILQVLFSKQNGWLFYSPIMLFSLVGLGWMLIKKERNAWLILTIFSLATYAFASWWAWWFGGAYGHRCYVEYLALMAFPLAYFFHKSLSFPTWAKAGLLVLGLAFCHYNSELTFWYSYTSPWDGEQWTWERVGEVLLKIYQ